jgi:hypothetical protein
MVIETGQVKALMHELNNQEHELKRYFMHEMC